MDFSNYIKLFRRWFWLIILATILAGGASYFVSHGQKPLYQTSALVQIGTFGNSPNADKGSLEAAQSLADYYFIIAKTSPVLQSIIDALKISGTPDDLAGFIKLATIQGTPFFTITVTYGDPEQAADIANQMAQQLINKSPVRATIETQNQIAELQKEIQRTQQQLDEDNAELKVISDALNDPGKLLSDPVNDTAILASRKTDLLTRITQEQANLGQYQTLLAAYQSKSNVNTLTIIEPAKPAQRSLGASTFRDSLLAAIVGAVLSIGVVALIEQLNTTIKTTAEITQLLNVPILGTIASFGRKGTYKKRLIAWNEPRSSVAESYRAVRVNLMYMGSPDGDPQDTPVVERSYLVTSTIEGEGKSITAANLAVSFAISGKQVVLIDADMRRPTQHKIFEVTNNEGLSTILQNAVAVPVPEEKPVLEGDPTEDPMFFERNKHADENSLLMAVPSSDVLFYTIPDELPLQKTKVPRLSLISSGPLPQNPADVLNSSKVREIVHRLTRDKGFDIVIFDTPPALDVSDSQLLANATGASVILVLEAGRTRRAAAVAAVERFSMLSMRVMGVVFNRAKPEQDERGLGSYYTEPPSGSGPNTRRKQLAAGEKTEQ